MANNFLCLKSKKKGINEEDLAFPHPPFARFLIFAIVEKWHIGLIHKA